MKLLIDGKSRIDYIERIPGQDGKFCYSSTSKYVLRDDSDNIIGIYGTGRDITENREAYKRLQMLTDTIPGGLATYELSPRGVRTLYLSDGIYVITGYAKEDYDFKSNDPLKLIFKEDVPELRRQIARIMKDETPINHTYRICRKDGTHRWVNLQAMVAEHNDDRVIVNAVLLNVTEQKEASIKIAESEQQNRIKYEHELKLRKELIKESVIYYQINLNSGIIEEYESKIGKKNSLVVGQKLDESRKFWANTYLHPDDYDRVYNEISPTVLKRNYREGKSTITCIYRRKLQDENYRYVKTNVVLMEKPDTQEIIAFMYCYDVDTEWKNQIAIETILDEDIESIFNIDITSGIAYIAHMQEKVNDTSLYHHFDFRYESNKTCESVVVKEDKDIFSKYYNIPNLIEYLKDEPIISATYRINENNDIHRKLMTAYYLDDEKRIMVMTRRDITKLVDEEQRQKEALQEAVKNAERANNAKSEFLSHMSHDLRTPLNAVLTYSNPELIDNASPEQLYEYLQKVNMSGDYLLSIINDVLDMSKIE